MAPGINIGLGNGNKPLPQWMFQNKKQQKFYDAIWCYWVLLNWLTQESAEDKPISWFVGYMENNDV